MVNPFPVQENISTEGGGELEDSILIMVAFERYGEMATSFLHIRLSGDGETAVPSPNKGKSSRAMNLRGERNR